MGEVGNVLEKPLHRLARACLKVGGENTFFSFIDSLNSVLEGLEENVHLAILNSSVNFSRPFNRHESFNARFVLSFGKRRLFGRKNLPPRRCIARRNSYV